MNKSYKYWIYCLRLPQKHSGRYILLYGIEGVGAGLTITDEKGYVFRGNFFKRIYANYKIKLHIFT